MSDKINEVLSKINDTFGKLRGEISNLKSTVDRNANIKAVVRDGRDGKNGINGRDGLPGKDGVTPDINSIVELVPKAVDGKEGAPGINGKDGLTPDINAIVELVPKAADGKNGLPGVNGKPGKPGRNGKDGQSITKVEVDRNNILYVFIDGIRKKVGNIVTRAPEFSGAAGGGSGDITRKDALGWNADYVSGDQVQANTMVNDDGWLMASKIKTDEPAAISPVGGEFNVYTGTLTPQSTVAKQIITGTRYTFEHGGYINGYRVDTVVGNNYSVFIVKDPLGTPIINELITFTGVILGFQTFNISPVIVSAGVMFDLVVVIHEPNPTPTVTNINYDYATPKNSEVPGNGEIVHAEKDSEFLSISKIDNDGGDRSVFLATLTIGDLILGPNITWSIQSIIDQGVYIDFIVAPTVLDSPDGVFSFGFETITATPISYGEDLNFWSATPNAQGLFIVDGEYKDIVPNDTARGTDLIVQHASTPIDWDVVMPPSNTVGGNGLTNVKLEPIGDFATSAGQLIGGLGAANLIQVNYGVGGTTPGGEFDVAATGILTCNTSDVQYHFGFVMRLSRNGGSGESIILLRLMYAPDGVEANAIQLQNTFLVQIDNPRTIWRESFEFDFAPVQGSLLWIEAARDPAGDNSGDISTLQPTGDVVTWNPSRSAALTIERFVTS